MGEEVNKSELNELKSDDSRTSNERVENERNLGLPECSRTREAKNETFPRTKCPQIGFQPTPNSTELCPVTEEKFERTSVSSVSGNSSPKGCDDFPMCNSHPDRKGYENSNMPTQFSSPDKQEEQSTSIEEFQLVILCDLIEKIWKKISSDMLNRFEIDGMIPLQLKASCALWDELSLPDTIVGGRVLVITVRDLENLLVGNVKNICSCLKLKLEEHILFSQNVASLSIPIIAKLSTLVTDIEKTKAVLDKIEGLISTDIKTVLEDCEVYLPPCNADSSSLTNGLKQDKMFTIQELKLILEKISEKFSITLEKMIESSLCGSS